MLIPDSGSVERSPLTGNLDYHQFSVVNTVIEDSRRGYKAGVVKAHCCAVKHAIGAFLNREAESTRGINCVSTTRSATSTVYTHIGSSNVTRSMTRSGTASWGVLADVPVAGASIADAAPRCRCRIHSCVSPSARPKIAMWRAKHCGRLERVKVLNNARSEKRKATDVNVIDLDDRRVRDDRFPVLLGLEKHSARHGPHDIRGSGRSGCRNERYRCGDRSPHQLEVQRLIIRDDPEIIARML